MTTDYILSPTYPWLALDPQPEPSHVIYRLMPRGDAREWRLEMLQNAPENEKLRGWPNCEDWTEDDLDLSALK